MNDASSKPGIVRRGILRRRGKTNDGNNNKPELRNIDGIGRVTFSKDSRTIKREDNDDNCVAGASSASRNRGKETDDKHGDGYDSDDLGDAILAYGDALSMRKLRPHEEDKAGEATDVDDPAVRSASEIEEAKRRRGQSRRQTHNGMGGNNPDDRSGVDHNNEDPTLSLIIDRSADPDAYESNAGLNASCPVEPFNMNSEQESGMGYFDGDTYIFRQGKPVEGEEDAWLDGFNDENEEITSGGLDSTSLWKPDDKRSTEYHLRRNKESGQIKFKFVTEDATPKEIGKRIATLLEGDHDCIMTALKRYGKTLRESQANQQKLKRNILQKAKVKTRKTSKNAISEGNLPKAQIETQAATNSDQATRNHEKAREIVEELTELADALLFRGETDAYELTKCDWIHRFNLEQYFPQQQQNVQVAPSKRSHGSEKELQPPKRKRRGYFDDVGSLETGGKVKDTQTKTDQHDEITWEYKGNEDGAIHGPYTSRQMLEWTTCGYFIGGNAVDIRQVQSVDASKSNVNNVNVNATEDRRVAKINADDLMADLMDDEDSKANGETFREDSEKVPNTMGSTAALKSDESAWARSDTIDFSLFL